jgi:hypothetical protein
VPSLFKRTSTTTDPSTGKTVRRKTTRWYGKYVDAEGVVRRVPLSANKTAAQQMLNELVKKAELGKAGIIDTFEKKGGASIVAFQNRLIDASPGMWVLVKKNPSGLPAARIG